MDELVAEWESLKARYSLDGWTLIINTRMTSFLGRCKSTRKEIHVAKWVLDNVGSERAINTLRHEVAHALTPGDHHGMLWKEKCRELGADPLRKADLDDDLIPSRANRTYRWIATCTRCDTGWLYTRKPRWNSGTHSGCPGVITPRRLAEGELE